MDTPPTCGSTTSLRDVHDVARGNCRCGDEHTLRVATSDRCVQCVQMARNREIFQDVLIARERHGADGEEPPGGISRAAT